MPDLTITIKGPLIKPAYQSMGGVEEIFNDALHNIVDSTADKMVTYFKDLIIRAIERSVELAAFVGQNADPEIIRNIINSVHVEKTPVFPPSITIEFKNDLGAWYGEPPQELLDMLKGIIDLALERVSTVDMDKMVEELTKE